MRKVALFVLGTIISADAMAGNSDAKQYWATWGGGAITKCLGDSIAGSNACIGASANNNCEPVYSTGNRKAVIMMVANEITGTYATFCPTQVDTFFGGRKGTVSTVYRKPSNAGNCVRLYVAYSGALMCDSETFFRDTYANAATVTSDVGNIESTIPMFASKDSAWDCGNTLGYLDHDVFLGIVDWTPGGHGAFVQPIQVRGARETWNNSDPASWPLLTPAKGSHRILACKSGYHPNVAGTNCEPFDIEQCAMNDGDKLANLCTTQNKAYYDQSQHKFIFNESKQCYELRCRQDSDGFSDAVTLTCSNCIQSARQGKNPINGECIDCPTGKIFRATAATDGYCVTATAYTHDALKYGPMKSKSLNDQCWTKFGNDYIDCVAGQGKSTASAGN